MSEFGCFSQHATDSHLCLSTHLLTPPGYEQPGTGLHDPLAGFNTWLGHGQSDRQNLSVSPFADSDDLVGGSGSSSSTSSRATTRQLGRVVIKSDNETLERNIRAQAGRQKGPQGLSKPASSDDDSPYCPGTGVLSHTMHMFCICNSKLAPLRHNAEQAARVVILCV